MIEPWSTEHRLQLTSKVVYRHISALAGEHVFEVRSSNQHTVKPWFQGKLDVSPPVADLASAGFPLVGGRVETIGGRRVAALVYQRREHVIDVFVAPVRGGIATSDARSIRGFQERHWVQADLSLWVVSDLNNREPFRIRPGIRIGDAVGTTVK